MTEVDPSLQCSFCTKSAKDVKKLIKGPEVYICDECIDLCHSILYSAEKPETAAKSAVDVPAKVTPKTIKEHLDKYVIGQDEAKIAVAVAVYDHYKRLDHAKDDEVEIDKSNILLLGPTGCGKTLIAQSIARHLDVPFAIADATSLTEAGYVGDDVESIITRLLHSADGDVKKAERGIIYLDEIDKKARRSESSSRDVSGEGVQQGLLKLLEGSEIMVPTNGKKGPNGDLVRVNTKNILFICGGAFVGLDKIVEKEISKEGSGIGFGAKSVGKKPDAETLMRRIEPEHLQKFGLIPELVGRLPIIAPLIELTDEQLIQVLTEPKNAVTRQFEKMFKMDGVELTFDTDALRAIAKEAKNRKTGARGLRAVVESALLKLKYELPDLQKGGVIRVLITEDVVKSGAQPSFEYAPVIVAAV
jgi:ATP-dependent Clp protease ATP-binding subunit ClpX